MAACSARVQWQSASPLQQGCCTCCGPESPAAGALAASAESPTSARPMCLLTYNKVGFSQTYITPTEAKQEE